MFAEIRTLALVALDTPRRTAATVRELLLRPTIFGKQRIGASPSSLRQALAFFLNLFAVSFLLGWFSERYFYYETDGSETRTLVILAFQFGIGVSIIFLLNVVFLRNRAPSYSALLQAALYADAIYLFVQATVLVVVGVYVTTHDRGTVTLDVVSTEWERCVADFSSLYWLTRGDTTYYFADDPNLANRVDWFNYYSQYFLVLPLIHYFAWLLRARFGIPYALNFVAGFLAFSTATVTTDYALQKFHGAIAEGSNCNGPVMKAALQKYSRSLVASQIAERANREVFAAFRANEVQLVKFENDKFVMRLPLSLPENEREQTVEHLRSVTHDLYCDRSSSIGRMHYLDAPIEILFEFRPGPYYDSVTISQEDCASGVYLGLGRKLERGPN